MTTERILTELAQQRILLLDGAMGTMIQALELKEADYRNERLAGHAGELLGNHDLLNITRPGAIRDIHTAFLAAGSDIITTNTFNSNAVSQAASMRRGRSSPPTSRISRCAIRPA